MGFERLFFTVANCCPCPVGRIFRQILKHSLLKGFIEHFRFSMVGVTIAMVKLAGGCVNRASRTVGEL